MENIRYRYIVVVNFLLPVLFQYLNVMLRPNEKWGDLLLIFFTLLYNFTLSRSYRDHT